jgi:hypothetical protein
VVVNADLDAVSDQNPVLDPDRVSVPDPDSVSVPDLGFL